MELLGEINLLIINEILYNIYVCLCILLFFTTKSHKGFSQRAQGANDGVTLCVLCAFFANLAVKYHAQFNYSINQNS